MCEIIIDGKTVEFKGSVLSQKDLKPYQKAKNIIICNTVTEIGEWAFSNFALLVSVEIPDSVVSIGMFAFNKCVSLRSIFVPKSIEEIKDCAFWKCTSLENITIPDSAKKIKIGSGAFCHCKTLKSIEIPQSVTSLGEDVFLGCNNIKIKVKTPNVFSSKSLLGAVGQILNIVFDCDEYPLITYSDGKSLNSMVVTGYVNYAKGQLYSGYKFDGSLNPKNKELVYMYCDGTLRNCLSDYSTSGLEAKIAEFNIR